MLRVTLALLMLLHGWAKIRYGIGSIEAKIESLGAPGFLAYAVYLGEVVAPCCCWWACGWCRPPW